MNNEYLNVNELKRYSTLTSKQIRNNLNSIKKLENYGGLIIGGGKGKGGQFWFHYSIIPLITIRQRKRKQRDIQTTKTNRCLSEFYYSKTKWDYFGCIKPNIETDIYQLINSLNNFSSFYVIHRKNEKNHIHFTIESSINLSDIKEQLKTYYTTSHISIDKIFLTKYNCDYNEKTLNYLLRRGNHNTKNDLIDWGLTIP
jgi:hypothetical protein